MGGGLGATSLASKMKILVLSLLVSMIITSCCMNCVLYNENTITTEVEDNTFLFEFYHNYFCSVEKLQPFALNEIYEFMKKQGYKTFEIVDTYDNKSGGGIYYYKIKFNQ